MSRTYVRQDYTRQDIRRLARNVTDALCAQQQTCLHADDVDAARAYSAAVDIVRHHAQALLDDTVQERSRS